MKAQKDPTRGSLAFWALLVIFAETDRELIELAIDGCPVQALRLG